MGWMIGSELLPFHSKKKGEKRNVVLCSCSKNGKAYHFDSWANFKVVRLYSPPLSQKGFSGFYLPTLLKRNSYLLEATVHLAGVEWSVSVMCRRIN